MKPFNVWCIYEWECSLVETKVTCFLPNSLILHSLEELQWGKAPVQKSWLSINKVMWWINPFQLSILFAKCKSHFSPKFVKRLCSWCCMITLPRMPRGLVRGVDVKFYFGHIVLLFLCVYNSHTHWELPSHLFHLSTSSWWKQTSVCESLTDPSDPIQIQLSKRALQQGNGIHDFMNSYSKNLCFLQVKGAACFLQLHVGDGGDPRLQLQTVLLEQEGGIHLSVSSALPQSSEETGFVSSGFLHIDRSRSRCSAWAVCR